MAIDLSRKQMIEQKRKEAALKASNKLKRVQRRQTAVHGIKNVKDKAGIKLGKVAGAAGAAAKKLLAMKKRAGKNSW